MSALTLRAGTGARAASWLPAAAGAIVTLAVPFLAVTLAVRLVIFTPWLYEYGFSAYNIPAVTGIERSELLRAAEETRRYFAGNYEPLDITVERQGAPFRLYNEREVAHMADVKALVQGVERVQWLSLAVIAAVLAVGLWARGRCWLRPFGTALAWGGVLTVALMAAAGLGAALFFDVLFLQFHLVSFTNDLWVLDPTRDFLIMMYPGGFFRDATLAIGGLALLLAALTGAAGLWLRGRAGPPPPPPVTPQSLLAEIEADVDALVRWFDTVLYPESVTLGDWNAKEMLGHLVYWHRSGAQAVVLAAAGRGPTRQQAPADAINAQVRQLTADVPVRELAVALTLSHHRLAEAVRLAPSADTVVRIRHDGTPRTLQELLLVTRDHVRHHLAELRRASMAGQGG